MAPDSGRHDADENATDRARIDYLAGEANVELDAAEQAELDELRALLADPTLWAEPPAALEDSVVAAIAAEAAALPPVDQGSPAVPDSPYDRPTETVRRPDDVVAFRPSAPSGGFPPAPSAGFPPAPPAGPPAPADPSAPAGPADP